MSSLSLKMIFFWRLCKNPELILITIFLRRRRPKTSNKLSQTRGRATACSSGGTLTQICYSPAGVTMGMSSNAVNTPVSVMGTSWQLAISSWNMLTCSLALLYWCLRETRAVACVWRGFGRPLPPLIRHLARWPMWATLAIMVMVTIKGIIVRVEQMMLSERLRWKLSQKGSDYCLMEAVVASIRLRNAYRGGIYLVGDGKVSISR